jgi:Spy/CpxP family protein refolding chaperone
LTLLTEGNSSLGFRDLKARDITMQRTVALALLLIPGWGVQSLAQVPAARSDSPAYSIDDFGLMPAAVPGQALLRTPGIQQELKLTDAQKQQHIALTEEQRARVQRARENYDVEIFQAASNAIAEDYETALQTVLEPAQRERLEQIRLQVQGPVAFEDRAVRRRLRLTIDQRDEIEAIVSAGAKELKKAATIPIVLNPGDDPKTVEAVRALVGRLEFQLAKERGRHQVLATRADVMLRIAKVLTVPQRAAYSKMLGAPFDIEKFKPQIDATELDVRRVAVSLGLRLGGQRADTAFDVSVARPAYTTTHPRVSIDEAHRNFHTASGRYKPFAGLLANDGYQVSPNRDILSTESLRRCDVLVIANATAAGSTGAPGADRSAFTDDECHAVHDWVKAGGALLLITDHSPFGARAEKLGKQFGVEMTKSAARDPANVALDSRGLLFSREKKLVGDHPITRGRNDSERISRVKTFTGQALKGPEGSAAILMFADTALITIDAKSVSAKGYSQGLALNFGKGRVVVLGEAAQLSAQLSGLERTPQNMMGMNAPGCDNRQLALNIMHWLSGLLEPRQLARTSGP